MPIPALNADGLLPAGLFDCSLADVRARFGSFQGIDTRQRLFARLEELVAAMQRSALFELLLIDGSFVTAKPSPNDIDLVAVLRTGLDFERDLPVSEYALVSRAMLRRRLDSTSSLRNGTVTCIRLTSNSSAESGRTRRRGRDCCD